MPRCTVLAGPNGSGKSTLYQSLAPPGTYLNADDIARDLRPDDPASAGLGSVDIHLRARTVAAR